MRANVQKLTGLRGQADQLGLIDWRQGFEKKPQRVFVVQGEDTVCEKFTTILKKDYGYASYAPFSGTRINLKTNQIEVETTGIPVTKKAIRSINDVFGRLLAAGNRLLAVIHKNEGGTNKDLAKFADQINSLCDKWER